MVGTDACKIYVVELEKIHKVKSKDGSIKEMNESDIIKIFGGSKRPQSELISLKYVTESCYCLENHDNPLTAVAISQDQSTIFSGTTGIDRIIWKQKVCEIPLKLDYLLIFDPNQAKRGGVIYPKNKIQFLNLKTA